VHLEPCHLKAGAAGATDYPLAYLIWSLAVQVLVSLMVGLETATGVRRLLVQDA
jgi:hypothetical protein